MTAIGLLHLLEEISATVWLLLRLEAVSTTFRTLAGGRATPLQLKQFCRALRQAKVEFLHYSRSDPEKFQRAGEVLWELACHARDTAESVEGAEDLAVSFRRHADEFQQRLDAISQQAKSAKLAAV